MQDQGEEIDGLITTQSKLRKTIMDATKVTSNQFKGVDILDNVGNYKSTYQILKEIAEIYEEIGEEDKKTGKNRQALITETIAGKTRAATAASILLNNDVLQEVYEAALNSTGSAQAELEKYLDSIEGKIAKLQNRIQELAATTIQSDWIKTTYDLMAEGVGIITKVTKSIGGLTTAIGVAIGAFSSFNNSGFMALDKLQGKFKVGDLSKGLMQVGRFVANTAIKGKNALAERFGGTNIPGLGSLTQTPVGVLADDPFVRLRSIATDSQSAKNIIEAQWGDLDTFFGKLSDKSKEAIEPLWDQLKDDTLSVGDLLKGVEDQSIKAVKDFSKAASNIAKTAFSTIVNTVASVAFTAFVGWVSSLVISGVDEMLHHLDNLIEAGDEAREKITDIFKEVEDGKNNIKDISVEIKVEGAETNSVLKNLEEIANRYADLKKGVNDLTNANKSLTTDKYQEYLDICNKLAKQYPSLVKGYDEQGNAILNIGNSAEECATSLLNMYDTSISLSNIKIAENMDKSLKGVLASITLIDSAIHALNLGELQDKINETQELTVSTGFKFVEDNDNLIDIENYDYSKVAELQKILDEHGLDIDVRPLQEVNFDSSVMRVAVAGLKDMLNDEEIDGIFSEWISKTNQKDLERLDELTDEMDKNMDKYTTDLAKRANAFAEATSDIGSYLKTKTTFTSLDGSIQSSVLANFKFDDKLAKKYTDTYKKDFEDFIYGEVLTPLYKLSADNRVSLSEILNFDYSTSNENIDTLRDNLTSQFRNLFGDKSHDMMLYFGITDMISNWDSQREFVINQLSANIKLTPEQRDKILIGMGPQDIQKAFTLLQSRTFTSFNRFIEALNAQAKELPKEGLLKDVLKNELFQEKAEAYEKNLSAFTTAITSSLESGGKLIGDAYKTFVDAMNGSYSGDITTEGLRTSALDQLNDYVKVLYDTASDQDMSPEGMKQLNNYISNLIMNYKTLDITASDVMERVSKNYLVYNREEQAFANTKEFQDMFGEHLEDENERKILYSLSLNPDSANWTAKKWKEQYDNAVINWNLFLDMTEYEQLVALAESELAEVQSKSSVALAQAEYKNLQGDYDTTAELNVQILASKENTEKFRKDLENLFDQNNPFTKAINDAIASGADEAEIEKLRADRRTEFNNIRGKINESLGTTDTLEFLKLTIPLTIIDNDQLRELKTEYDTVLKPELEKYGDKTQIPSTLYQSMMNNLSSQIGQNQEKLSLIDTFLQVDGLSAEDKQKLTEMAGAINQELITLMDNLSTVSDDSSFNNDRIAIALLEAQKSTMQALQETKDTDLTEADYLGLKAINEQIKEGWDNIEKTASGQKLDLLKQSGWNLENLLPNQRKAYEDADAIWREAVAKSAEYAKEITENTRNAEILPMTRLEQELEQLEQNASTLKTQIEEIADLEGSTNVPSKMLAQLATNYGLQASKNQRLSNMYAQYASGLPENSQIRRDYESKSVQYGNTVPGLKKQAREVIESIDTKTIDGLQLKLDLLNTEAEDLQYNLNNAIRPLTEKDYQEAIDNNTERIENLLKQEEYWTQKLNRTDVSKVSLQYLGYLKNLKSVQDQLRDLTKAQLDYNKAIGQLSLDNINKQLEQYQKNLERLDLEQGLKEAQGETKDKSYYQERDKNLKGSFEENRQGMKTTGKLIREAAGALFNPVTSPINMLRPQNNLETLVNPLNTTVNPLEVGKIDANYIKTLSDQWDTYYNNAIKNQTEIAQNDREQLELKSEQIKSTLQDLEVSEEFADVLRKNNELRNQGLDVSEDDRNKEIEYYTVRELALNSLKQQYEMLAEAFKGTEFESGYRSSLQEVESWISEVNEKQITLRTEAGQQQLKALGASMDDLSRRYNRLNTELGSENRSMSEKDIYTGQIDITQEQLATARQQELINTTLMNFYEEGSTEYENFKKQAEDASDQVISYSANLVTLRKNLEALPENRIAKTIERNNVKLSNERSKISYKQSTNSTIISSDYDSILSTDESNVRQNEELLRLAEEERNNYTNLFQNRTNLTEREQEELLKKEQAVLEAEQAVYDAQAQLANDQNAANEAIFGEFDKRMELLNRQKDLIASENTLDDALGKRRTSTDIEVDLNLARSSVDEIQNEIDNLSVDDFEAATPELRQEAYDKKMAELETQRNEAEAAVANLERELFEQPAKVLERRLQLLKDQYGDTQLEIADIKRLGDLIPEDVLNEAIEKGGDIVTLIKTIKQLYLDMAETAEKSGDIIGAETYKQNARDLESQEDEQLDTNKGNEDLIDEQNIQVQQNALAKLQLTAKEYQNTLSDSTQKATKDTYRNLLANSTAQIDNIRRQIAYYEELRKSLGNVSEDNEFYQQYTNTINGLNDDMLALIQSQREWNKAMDELDMKAVNDKLDEYSDKLKDIQHNIALNSAKGIEKSMEDYLAEDEQYRNTISDSRSKVADLKEQRATRISLGEFTVGSEMDELIKSQIETLEDAADDAEEKLAQNANAEFFLPFENEIKSLEIRQQALNNAINTKLANGNKKTKQDIIDGIALSKDFEDLYQNELDAFLEEHPGELTIGELKIKSDIEANLAQAQAESANGVKEMIEKDNEPIQMMIDHYADSIQNVDGQMESLIKQGKEIPDYMFTVKINDIEGEMGQIERMKEFFTGLIDTYGDEHPEWAETWRDTINSLIEQYNNLEGQMIDTKEQKDNKLLTNLGNQLDDLKRKASEAQKQMSKSSTNITKEAYENSINIATEEQKNLLEQMEIISGQMSGLDYNTEKYQTLQSQLESLTDEYYDLTDSVNAWADAIKNLPIESAIKNLEDFEKQFAIRNEKKENDAAKGYRMTQEDYEDRIRGNQYLADESFRLAQAQAKNADDLARVGGRGSEEWQSYMDSYEQYMQKYRDYTEAVAEDNEKIELLPIEQLKRDQTKIQGEFAKIEQEIEKLSTKGMDVTSDLLSALISNINEEVANLKKQRKEYEQDLSEATEKDLQDAVDTASQNIDDVDAQIAKLLNQKYTLTIQIDRKPIEETENAIKKLSGEINILKEQLGNVTDTDVKRQDILNSLLDKELKNQKLIREERGQQSQVLEDIINATNGQANYFNNEEFRTAQDAIDSLTLSLLSSMQAFAQYKDSINSLPINLLNNQMETLKHNQSRNQSANSTITTLGGMQDYGTTTLDSQKIADQQLALVDAYRIKMGKALDDYKNETNEDQKAIFKGIYEQSIRDWLSAIQEADAFDLDVLENKLAEIHSPVEALERHMSTLHNRTNTVLNDVNELVEAGYAGAEEQYKSLINLNNSSINTINRTKLALEEERQGLIALINEGGASQQDNERLSQIDEQLIQLDEDTRALVKSTLEYQEMLNGGIALVGLTRIQDRLSRENKAIQDEIALTESRGLLMTADQYNRITQNTVDRIAAKEAEIEYLKQERSVVKDNIAEYNRLSEEIANAQSEVSSLTQEQEQYNEQMTNFASNYANTLKGTIESVLSESASATGVTSESVKTLTGLLHELEDAGDFDLSALFYNTSEGIKVNSDSLDSFIKISKRAYSNSLLNMIQEQNELYEKQGLNIKNLTNVTNGFANNQKKSSRETINQLNQELTKYNAIMTAIEQANSQYAKWQNAQSSESKGSKYDTVQSSLVEIEERLDRGVMLESDKEFSKLVSGRELTQEELLSMMPSLVKYFTGNMDGIVNFLDRLVHEGFGTLEDGVYNFENINLEQLSDVIDMPIEAIKMLMDKSAEYGVEFNYVNGPMDAYIKAREAYNNYYDAQEKLNEARINGDEKSINFYQQEMQKQKDLATYYDSYVDASTMTEEEFLNSISYIQQLQVKMANEVAGAEKEILREKIQEYALEHGVELTEDGIGILTRTREQAIENLENYYANLPETEEIPVTVKLDQSSLEELARRDDVNINLNIDKNNIVNEVQEALDQQPFKIDVVLDQVLNVNLNSTSIKMDKNGVKIQKSSSVNPNAAYANGTKNGALDSDQYALSNELGTEGLIRDGKLYPIPGGMHIQKFKKGDVILNTRQMKELMENGEASGKAKIVGGENALSAYANATGGGVLNNGDRDGSATNFGNRAARNEAEKTIPTYMDNIQRYLNRLSKAISNLDNSITEYTSATRKREILEEKYTLALEQVSASSKASTEYLKQANELYSKGYQYKAGDTIKTFDWKIWLPYFGLTIEDIRNGNLSMTKFDGQYPEFERLFKEAVEEYQNKYDQSVDALSNTQDLTGALTDLYEAMVKAPFEELDRDLNKLNDELSTLDAFSNTVQNYGESGARMLSQVLQQYFGADGASRFDGTGKTYEVLNKQLQKNTELKKEELETSIADLEIAKLEYAQLQHNNSEFESQLEEIKKTIINALGDTLSDEDREAIQNGEALDTETIAKYGEHNITLLTKYTDLVSKIDASLEALKSTSDEITSRTEGMYQTAASYVDSMMNETVQGMENVDNYYRSLENYVNTLNEGLKQSTDYIRRWLRVSDNAGVLTADYEQQIANQYERMAILAQSIAEQEAILNAALASGDIHIGDDKYNELMAKLQELRNEYNAIPNDINEYKEAQINIPNDIVTEKLEDIANAYMLLTTAIDKNISSSLSSIKAFEKISGIGLFNTTGNPNEIAYQNALIDADVRKAQEEAEAASIGYQQALANFNAGSSSAEEYEMKRQALYTAQQTMAEKTAEAATKMVEQYSKKFENITNYYNTLNSLTDTFITHLENQNTLLTDGSNIITKGSQILDNYQSILGYTREKMDNLRVTSAQLKQVLAEGLAKGDIVENDQEWVRLTTQIAETENQIESLGITAHETFKNMIETPLKETEARLERISQLYSNLNSSMQYDIAGSKTTRALANQYTDQYMSDPNHMYDREGYGANDGKTYEYKRQERARNLQQENDILQEAIRAKNDAFAVVARLNMEGADPAEIQAGYEALEKADAKVIEQQDKVISTRVLNVLDNVADIKKYYEEIIQYEEQLANIVASTNDLIIKGSGYVRNVSTITGNVQSQLETNAQKQINLQTSIAEMQKELDEGIARGDILEDSSDEKYRELTSNIASAENELIAAKSEQLDLNQALMDIPSKVAEEKLGIIEQAYRGITTAMSEGIAESADMVRAFNRITEGNYEQESMNPFYMLGDDEPEYIYLNRLLGSATAKATQETEVALQAYKKTQQTYNEMLNDENVSFEELEQGRKAKETAYTTYIEKAAAQASAQVNGWLNSIRNIKSYYDSLNVIGDAQINQLKALNEGIALTSDNVLAQSGNMSKIMALTAQQAANLSAEADALEKGLQEAVNSGDIKVGSKAYREQQAEIINTRTEVINLNNSTQEYIKTLLKLPTDQVAKTLSKLTGQFTNLKKAFENGLSDSNSMLVILQQFQDTLGSTLTSFDKIRNFRTPYNEVDQRVYNSNSMFGLSSIRNIQDITTEKDNSATEEMQQYWKAYQTALALYDKMIEEPSKYTAEQIKAARETLLESKGAFLDSQDKWISAAQQMAQQLLTNIEQYYSSIQGYVSAVASDIQATRDNLVELDGYIGHTKDIAKTYKDEINNSIEESRYLSEEIRALTMQTKYNVERGYLTIDSNEYRETMAKIKGLETLLKQTEKARIELYKGLMSLPVNLATANIEEIEKKYSDLTTVIETGIIDSSNAQRMFNKISNKVGLKSDFSDYFDTRTYVGQNQVVLDDLAKSVEETQEKISAANVARRVYEDLKASGKATEEQLRAAEQVASETYGEAKKYIADTAKKENEATAEMMTDIKTFFDNINSWFTTLSNNYKSLRDYMTQTNQINEKYAKNVEALFTKDIDVVRKQFTTTLTEADILLARLNDNMAKGIIKPNTQEYANAVAEIEAVGNQAINTASSMHQLAEEMYDLPNTVAAAEVERLTTRFQELNEAISSGVTSTKGRQKVLKDLAEELAKSNPYIDVDKYNYALEETFVGQNAALSLNISKARKELEYYAEAQMKAHENYNLLDNDAEAKKEDLEAANKAMIKSDQNFAQAAYNYDSAIAEYAQQSVQNINTYYEKLNSRLDSVMSRYEKSREIIQKFNSELDNSGVLVDDVASIVDTYRKQIELANQKQDNLTKSIVEQEKQMVEIAKRLGEDSEEYIEAQNNLDSLRNSFDDLKISVDEYADAIREAEIITPFTRQIERLQMLRDGFGALNGLIRENGKVTLEGDYTDMGRLSVALDYASYEAASEEVKKLEEEMKALDERRKIDESYSPDQYLLDYTNIHGQYISALQAVNQAEESAYNQEKNRYQQEINYVKELISARSKELSKQKELADYDRTLKQKNNSIKQIEAQIRALERLDNVEANALRKRLQEQLKNSQDDLDQTVESHVIQLRQEGLSELSERLDKGFERAIKEIDISIEKQMELMRNLGADILPYEQANNEATQAILQKYGDADLGLLTSTDQISTNIQGLNTAYLTPITGLSEALTQDFADIYKEKLDEYNEKQETRHMSLINLSDAFNAYKEEEETDNATRASYYQQIQTLFESLSSPEGVVTQNMNKLIAKVQEDNGIIQGNQVTTADLLRGIQGEYQTVFTQIDLAIRDTNENFVTRMNQTDINSNAGKTNSLLVSIKDILSSLSNTLPSQSDIDNLLKGIQDANKASASGSGSATGYQNTWTEKQDAKGNTQRNVQGTQGSSNTINPNRQNSHTSITGTQGSSGVVRNVDSNGILSLDAPNANTINVDSNGVISLDPPTGGNKSNGSASNGSVVTINGNKFTESEPVNKTNGSGSAVAKIQKATSAVQNAKNNYASASQIPGFAPAETQESYTNYQNQLKQALAQAKKLDAGIYSIDEIAPLLDKRIVDAYKASGGQIIIDPSFKDGDGLYEGQLANITLQSGENDHVYHELGHFVGDMLQVWKKSDFLSIYSAEKDKFPGTYYLYAQTSPDEYFAEAFREYTLNASKLRSAVPRTYAYIQSALAKFTPENIKVIKDSYAETRKRANRYATGTLSAKAGLAEVAENGNELILPNNHTYVAMKGGEGVIPAKETEVLLSLAKVVSTGTAYKSALNQYTTNLKQVDALHQAMEEEILTDKVIGERVLGAISYDAESVTKELSTLLTSEQLQGDMIPLKDQIADNAALNTEQNALLINQINQNIAMMDKYTQMQQLETYETRVISDTTKDLIEVVHQESASINGHLNKNRTTNMDQTRTIEKQTSEIKTISARQQELQKEEISLAQNMVEEGNTVIEEIQSAKTDKPFSIELTPSGNVKKAEENMKQAKAGYISLEEAAQKNATAQMIQQMSNLVAQGMINQNVTAEELTAMRQSITNMQNYISNRSTSTVHFDNLININGTPTPETVNEIKDIAQQLVSNRRFLEQMTDNISKRQAQDRKMAGQRILVK